MSRMRVVFTHLFVEDFGWYETEYRPSHYKHVETFGVDPKEDAYIFLATDEDGFVDVFKGYKYIE